MAKIFVVKQRMLGIRRKDRTGGGIVVLEIRIPAQDEEEARNLYRGLIGPGMRRESYTITEETLVDATQSGATSGGATGGLG